MNTPIEATPNESNNQHHEPNAKRAIPVKLGHHEERTIEVELGRSVYTILEIVATERGCKVEELALYRDDEDEPLANIVVIDVDYPHQRRHHVHHAHDVKVTVYYQGRDKGRDFKRNATIGDVLEWAIDEFKIDPSMASEFELALHGQTTELSASEHVGHLAGHHQELSLDLIRGDIANGACA
jgi:hypothetical protein